MKNLILAILFLAGTTVMAQSTSLTTSTATSVQSDKATPKMMGKAEIQKSLDITEAEAAKVWDLQQKYCGPEAKANAPDASPSKKESTKKQHEAFYTALLDVIPADKAKKLINECSMVCELGEAKAESKSGKSCCAASAGTKTCSDKKK